MPDAVKNLKLFFFVELFGSHNFVSVLQMGGIMAGILLVLSVLGYLLYAAIMGGSYCVVFTMDDEGILQEQQPKQAKKASIVADLLILAGIAAGRPGVVGMGMSSARRTSMYTTFKGTKKLTSLPKKNTIKLDSPMDHNRIWCDPEDFDFV